MKHAKMSFYIVSAIRSFQRKIMTVITAVATAAKSTREPGGTSPVMRLI